MSAVLIAFALALTFIGTQTSYWLFKVLPGFVWWALAFYWNQLPVSTDPSLRTILVLVPIFLGLACLFWGFWVSKKLPTGMEKNGFKFPFTSDEDDKEEPSRRSLSRSEQIALYERRTNRAVRGVRNRRG